MGLVVDAQVKEKVLREMMHLSNRFFIKDKLFLYDLKRH
ncbi:MAG: hypothetical protein RI956_825 [Pseudomonadota bacterium]|jgi:hypothetical protein